MALYLVGEETQAPQGRAVAGGTVAEPGRGPVSPGLRPVPLPHKHSLPSLTNRTKCLALPEDELYRATGMFYDRMGGWHNSINFLNITALWT